MNQKRQVAAHFDIHLKNINKGPLFNNESTVITVPLKRDDVADIWEAIGINAEWVNIRGIGIIRVDEIKRVVRVFEDDM